MRGKSWQIWQRVAPPAAQVVLDRAMERAAHEPEHPGFRWAKRCLGENGEAPLWGESGPLRLTPGISWEELIRVEGDVTKLVSVPFPPQMKEIAPGAFSMSGEDRHPKYQGSHPVLMARPYVIGVFAVTQAEWQALMGYNPSHKKYDQNPVESITWYEAVAFCNALSSLCGLSLAYDLQNPHLPLATDGFRLPTEAEWEFAATDRGGTRFLPHDRMRLVAWISDHHSPVPAPQPVGLKKPHAGLYDIFGNVNEWTQDWAGAFAFSGGTVLAVGRVNPTGSPEGSSKIRRGGSFSNHPPYIGPEIRLPYDPTCGHRNTGMRLARTTLRS